MSDSTNNSLVSFGDISKPADTLIKKVSKAVGGVFAPYQIKRMAKAEAEAAMITAQTEIQITDLHRRAMHRFIEEEAQRQSNIEQITDKALPLLQDNADAENMEDDWVTNFFDKSRIVSNDEMQELWSRVLAGEVNAPGSYSKRTVNLLGDLDKSDAELFIKLCSFGWIVGNFTPLVFDSEAKIYNDHGINFSTLSHLESLGLIQFQGLSGFNRRELPKQFPVFYCGEPLILTMPKDTGNMLTIGKVLLTRAGRELSAVCNSPGIPEFREYVMTKWKEHLPNNDNELSSADLTPTAPQSDSNDKPIPKSEARPK